MSTLTMQSDLHTTPWYKQFWPWFLIALPATAVIGSLITIRIALHEPDGLVAGDYYKQGLAINETLAQDRTALFLGLEANGQFDVDEGLVRLTLTGKHAIPVRQLKLSLLHPTRANKDTIIILDRSSDSYTFTGKLSQPEPANWHIHLQPADKGWRLSGRLALPEQTRFTLQSPLK